MTQTKHTPGPWSLKEWNYRRPDSSSSWFVFGPDDQPLHSPGGDCGTLRSPEPYAGYGFTRADARLIVAAPDLLEALQNLENDDGSIPAHAWDMVQTAIAKATGDAI